MKILSYTILTIALSGSVAFAAEAPAKAPVANAKPAGATSTPAPVQLTPEQQKEARKKNIQTQIEQWSKMKKEDKIKLVTSQHEAMMKGITAHWDGMNDDQRIAEHDKMLEMQKQQIEKQ